MKFSPVSNFGDHSLSPYLNQGGIMPTTLLLPLNFQIFLRHCVQDQAEKSFKVQVEYA